MYSACNKKNVLLDRSDHQGYLGRATGTDSITASCIHQEKKSIALWWRLYDTGTAKVGQGNEVLVHMHESSVAAKKCSTRYSVLYSVLRSIVRVLALYRYCTGTVLYWWHQYKVGDLLHTLHLPESRGKGKKYWMEYR